MRINMNKLVSTAALIGAALFASITISSTAHADGLVANASDLSKQDRQALEHAIAQYRVENPAAFARVRNVKGYKPSIYKKYRNPVPLVGRELRRLGPEALLPMVEALAFDVWDRAGATDEEWAALGAGMLQAVGALRDARSLPVLHAAFAKALDHRVLRTAAESMGDLCDDASFGILEASLAGKKRAAAIEGLGHCKGVASAKLLASMLDSLFDKASAGDAERIAHALGRLSASWAWRALRSSGGGEARHAEGLEVRAIASAALVRAFVRFDGEAQRNAHVALSMAQHPNIRAIASQHRGAPPAAVAEALDRVVAVIEARAK
jgi:hypothetical protein